MARNTCSVASLKKDVAWYVQSNETIPMAMTEGNDRSISLAMTTIVKGMAMMAKNGMEDIKA